MPYTFILLIGFFIFDVIYKQYFQKIESDDIDLNAGEKDDFKQGKRKTTFADLVRRFEEQFEDETKSRYQEEITEDPEIRREGIGSSSRDERIEKQRAKVLKHSDYEKDRRLQRAEVLKKASLADHQVPLASRMSKRNMDDYDLDKRRKASIDALEISKETLHKEKSEFLNIKDDILKGVIYAEILSKPKSLEKK